MMLGLILTIAITLCGVLIVKTIVNIMDNVNSLKTLNTPIPCPPHDWWEIHDELGNDLGLICIVCSKRPEEMQ